MTPEELAELDCHLAAGTDLPTALAALPRDEQPATRHDPAFQVGMVLGLVGFILYLLWRCA